MPRKIKLNSAEEVSTSQPAMTPEARQNQLTALAVGLAEQKLRDGTASSQIIAHFLKSASPKDKLELEILECQKELLKAKTEAYRSAAKAEVSYQEVIEALRRYGGLNENGSDKNVFRDD